MFYRLRVRLADVIDWFDDHILGHHFYWACKLIAFKLYPQNHSPMLTGKGNLIIRGTLWLTSPVYLGKHITLVGESRG